MTDSERQQILKMLAEGKITAEEGLKLIQALENSGEPEDEPNAPVVEPVPAAPPTPSDPDPVIERLKRKVRSLYVIPLFVGVLMTVFFAWWMYQSIQAEQMGFVFYCLLLPALLLGILLLAVGASSRTSGWMYIDIQQKPGEQPGRILIGFPLNLIHWLIHLFGTHIPENQRGAADLVMKTMNQAAGSEPLVVQVDEGEDGEKVQVYIG